MFFLVVIDDGGEFSLVLEFSTLIIMLWLCFISFLFLYFNLRQGGLNVFPNTMLLCADIQWWSNE